jgi:hypothetical protein
MMGGLKLVKIFGLPWWVVIVGGYLLLRSGVLSNLTGSPTGLVGGGGSGTTAQTGG